VFVAELRVNPRVGILPVLDVLEKHRIPATIATDALTAQQRVAH
jgi:hypothetical protein